MPCDFTPQRVVCLQPSATLDACETWACSIALSACTKYCADVCPEAADDSRLIVSDSWTAQAAQILAAKPDLVLASVPYQLEAVSEILQGGNPVPRSGSPNSRRHLRRHRRNRRNHGRAGARRSRHRRHASRDRGSALTIAQPAERPRVFCEEWGKPIIASQPWVAELIEVAGGTVVGEPGKTISAEDVAQLQPDVLLAAWCGAGDRVPLEKIVQQRDWTDLPAVRARRVFCINDELLNTPATSLIGGLHAIAWALHPNRFPQPAGIRQLADL